MTATEPSTKSAFLAAIRDNLGDDAPRLIYADYLDGVETGIVIDAARAEFIRVQCELARLGEPHIQVTEQCWLTRRYGPNYYTMTGGEELDHGNGRLIFEAMVGRRVDVLKPMFGTSKKVYEPMYGLRIHKIKDDEIIVVKDDKSRRWEGESLRRREREIWQKWFGEQHDLLFKVQAGFFTNGGFENANGSYKFSRGFLSHVTTTMDAWAGSVCSYCPVPGQAMPPRQGCYYHHGTGRVNAHGPAIVRAECAAVERVEFSDKRPLHFGGKWSWRLAGNGINDRHDIPKELWWDHPVNGFISHDSEADAVAALSRAAIGWAWN